MKKVALLFLGFMVTGMVAQKAVTDYAYVIVPQQFEFIQGKDKYQLNSMTKYYLNKNGFNAFFTTETPNLPNCDGLFADVLEEKAFLRTQVFVVLNDCNGNEVYRGPTGSSKYKDWKKAYQDALRQSFDDFIIVDQDLNQSGIVASVEKPESEQEIEKVTEDTVEVNLEDKANGSKIHVDEAKKMSVVKQNRNAATEVTVDTTSRNNLPADKYTTYTRGSDKFLLKESEGSFVLYRSNSDQERGLELLGKIMDSKTSPYFLDVNGARRDVYIDGSGNITIFNGDVPENYRIQN